MTFGDMGVVFSAGAAAIGWLWQRWREQKSIRVAIVAEVIALRKIAELRGYLSGLNNAVSMLESLPENERPKLPGGIAVADHYCRVYVANLSKLGYLSGKDALLVVTFYQYIDSVVRDVTDGGILHAGCNNPEAFREAASILKTALDLAKVLEQRHQKSDATFSST